MKTLEAKERMEVIRLSTAFAVRWSKFSGPVAMRKVAFANANIARAGKDLLPYERGLPKGHGLPTLEQELANDKA